MKDYSSFYFEGCTVVELEKNSTTKCLGDVLKDLMALETLREPFVWDKKYQNTIDIRPNVYDYDNVFVDFIKENDLLVEFLRKEHKINSKFWFEPYDYKSFDDRGIEYTIKYDIKCGILK